MKDKKLIYLLLPCVVIIAFLTIDWQQNSIHAGGIDTLKEMLHAAIQVDFTLVPNALQAMLVTVTYAATGLSVAIVLGIFLGVLSAGLLLPNHLQRPSTSLLAFMRAIHELIWALFFVAAIGLTPQTAILAIAIPYGGMLGRVYATQFSAVDHKRIQALKQLGLKPLSLIVFGYIPQAFKHMVSYTLYRFECAVRASSVLSFVGLAGLGMKIQLALSDLKYAEAFTYLYVLIIIVIVIDLWSQHYRRHQDKVSLKMLALLFIGAWLNVLFVEGALYKPLFTHKNVEYTVAFLKGLMGFNTQNIAFFDINEIKLVLKLLIETLQMSIIAITLSTLFMLVTVIGGTKTYSRKGSFHFTRFTYLISRAVPELIWAMIVVFIFKPGIWAGALAMALHNAGILSKLCAEVIEDIDTGPLDNLKSSGVSKKQLLYFGVFPLAIKKILNYIIYRWEIILRTTIIVGFIGAGGLGYYFRYHLSLFHYTHVTLVIVAYLLLVKFSDFLTKRMIIEA